MQLIQSNSLLRLADFIAKETNVQGLQESIESLRGNNHYKGMRDLDPSHFVGVIEKSGLFIADQIFYQALPVPIKVKEKTEPTTSRSAVGVADIAERVRVLEHNCSSGDDGFSGGRTDMQVIFDPVENFDLSQMVIVSLQLKSHVGHCSKRKPIGWSLPVAAHDFVRILFDRDFYILEEANYEYCNVYLIMEYETVCKLVTICNDQELLISHVIERKN